MTFISSLYLYQQRAGIIHSFALQLPVQHHVISRTGTAIALPARLKREANDFTMHALQHIHFKQDDPPELCCPPSHHLHQP